LKGDILNTNKVFKYPKIDTSKELINNRLSSQKIIKLIEDHCDFIDKFNENIDFYIGKNISLRQNIDKTTPDNDINIPYARTLTNTIKGYMYQSGLITYKLEDEVYQDNFNLLQEIFKDNKETLINSEHGEAQSKFGISFELMYLKENKNGKIMPFFKVIDPQEVIPIYDYSIDSNLISAIRYYCTDNEDSKVEVYYKDIIEYFELKKNKKDVRELVFIEQKANYFFDIPFNIFKNNDELQSDYEPVKGSIQLYDKILSDSANELDRFASAYLVMVNYIIGGNDEESKDKIERFKKLRVFEIDKDGDVRFLTKNIPIDFFREIKDTIKNDILYHTQIPDFRDASFATISGIALKYKLIGFENLCAGKESYFREGLERRIRLIENFLKISIDQIILDKIVIKFTRNLPNNDIEEIDNFKKIDPDGGKVSKRTALSLLSFVSNVNDEIEAIDEENKKKQEETASQFDLDNFEIDEGNNQSDIQNQGNINEEIKQGINNE
jgi:SPP1 family phage portal protein